MGVELYNDGKHIVHAFYDLVDDSPTGAVQSNQFLIADHGHGALIDPGGNMTYSGLLMDMQQYFPSRDLDYILASHPDPDIIASVNKWFIASHCKVLISNLWTRFVPHFTNGKDISGRIVGIPDQGAQIALGQCKIIALPAHFLHSEGNFQFYDPIAKILFSGDLGASMVPHELAAEPVSDFASHVRFMEGFHRRYIVSRKVARFWANMVRQLDIEQIVPQHGSRFAGKAAVNDFISWVEGIECGVDLMTQAHYCVPQ
ncbi:MBL fold metallo-hydrolase [Dechloromonas denitrificans]|uniref:MBL fold metallo-hydrolase n=1 Tax=Dechloromonas denitrificans TaxID=281362 RepID=A0A133XDD0_9RHOO|nr:MBL fold metallo-hydrolase [Dechloromonas denitrificans]KXB28943.1 MBL fold metallo-hydrolase [Dechloromonas denitrificans]